GKDTKNQAYEDYRWSRFKNRKAEEMYEIVSEHVFPFLRTMGAEGSTYARHMKDARFTIPTPALLAKVVDMLAKVPMEERDRTNRPLTSTDIAELERIPLDSGVGTSEDVQRAAASNHGLGLFVRSLVGLDRGAAKEAFAAFLSGKSLAANQIEFVNMIVDHLTENGAMDPALLYSSPYTDFSPRGVDGVFGTRDTAEIVSILRSVSKTAAA